MERNYRKYLWHVLADRFFDFFSTQDGVLYELKIITLFSVT